MSMHRAKGSWSRLAWNGTFIVAMLSVCLLAFSWLRSFLRYDALIRCNASGTYTRVLSSRGAIHLQLARRCPFGSSGWEWLVARTEPLPFAVPNWLQRRGDDGNVWTLEIIDSRPGSDGAAMSLGGPQTWSANLAIPYWLLFLLSLVLP